MTAVTGWCLSCQLAELILRTVAGLPSQVLAWAYYGLLCLLTQGDKNHGATICSIFLLTNNGMIIFFCVLPNMPREVEHQKALLVHETWHDSKNHCKSIRDDIVIYVVHLGYLGVGPLDFIEASIYRCSEHLITRASFFLVLLTGKLYPPSAPSAG